MTLRTYALSEGELDQGETSTSACGCGEATGGVDEGQDGAEAATAMHPPVLGPSWLTGRLLATRTVGARRSRRSRVWSAERERSRVPAVSAGAVAVFDVAASAQLQLPGHAPGRDRRPAARCGFAAPAGHAPRARCAGPDPPVEEVGYSSLTFRSVESVPPTRHPSRPSSGHSFSASRASCSRPSVPIKSKPRPHQAEPWPASIALR